MGIHLRDKNTILTEVLDGCSWFKVLGGEVCLRFCGGWLKWLLNDCAAGRGCT